MAEVIGESQKKIDGFDKWIVEDAARSLRKAQEILAQPKLLKAAKKILTQEKKATTKALDWADNL
jgi:hypothetical protein